MARIDLDLAHAYGAAASGATANGAAPRHAHVLRDDDYALRPLTMRFEDGGAYALLGPSGCGKTTMLNLISGLLQPSHGTVHFDGVDVTALSPQARNIAQVFQFPVVYDTMTVRDNLAFPLRNRGVPSPLISARVGAIAELLDLSGQLDRRASGLSADAKQRISLGRGLVREDVAAVLFDEPLTVIDPQLKWQLRRKLKEIHRELKLTLIYVTHDQVEALTFADQVVVMMRGRAMQTGSAAELYQRPSHPFVGHFIGSPGMNFIRARVEAFALVLAGQRVPLSAGGDRATLRTEFPAGDFVLGVRPEYVTLAEAHAPGALLGEITHRQDLGTYVLVSARVGVGADTVTVRARLHADAPTPSVGEQVWLALAGSQSCAYPPAMFDEFLDAGTL